MTGEFPSDSDNYRLLLGFCSTKRAAALSDWLAITAAYARTPHAVDAMESQLGHITHASRRFRT